MMMVHDGSKLSLFLIQFVVVSLNDVWRFPAPSAFG